MPNNGGLEASNEPLEKVDANGTDESSSEDGQLFNSLFTEQIELAQSSVGTKEVGDLEITDSKAESADSSDDPLASFWNSREESVTRFIPEMDKIDNSWKPLYDQIVKSEGYGLIQDYQHNFESLFNRINVLSPEGEREQLWKDVVSFMKGEEGAEANLAGSPEILENVRAMKEIGQNPEFNATRHLAAEITPMIAYSVQGREIMAEETAKSGPLAASMQLLFESNQLKRFVESMSIRKAPKILVNDSSTRA